MRQADERPFQLLGVLGVQQADKSVQDSLEVRVELLTEILGQDIEQFQQRLLGQIRGGGKTFQEQVYNKVLLVQQLRQGDYLATALAEVVVLLGEIEHVPFLNRLLEVGGILLFVELLVPMADVVEGQVPQVDFIYPISERFELRVKNV